MQGTVLVKKSTNAQPNIVVEDAVDGLVLIPEYHLWTPHQGMGTDTVSPNRGRTSSAGHKDGDSQVVVACSNVEPPGRLNRDRVGGAGVKNPATDEKYNGRYFTPKG